MGIAILEGLGASRDPTYECQLGLICRVSNQPYAANKSRGSRYKDPAGADSRYHGEALILDHQRHQDGHDEP